MVSKNRNDYIFTKPESNKNYTLKNVKKKLTTLGKQKKEKIRKKLANENLYKTLYSNCFF